MTYGTWTSAVIEGPVSKKIAKEAEDAAEAYGLEVDERDGDLILSGPSKYDPEIDWAHLSRKGNRITVDADYEYEEMSKERTAYENGAAVAGWHDELVPDNLRELIADARTALEFEGTLSPGIMDAIAGALENLVNALDPEGARA